VLLLNAVDASAGIAVASLGVVMVISGAAFGYFADRLPELPGARRRRSQASARLADIHNGRR
jgi:MFS family permease